jgi:large subunit ribosomal protein L4
LEKIKNLFHFLKKKYKKKLKRKRQKREHKESMTDVKRKEGKKIIKKVVKIPAKKEEKVKKKAESIASKKMEAGVSLVKKESGLTTDVLNVNGEKVESITLPKAIFGVKVNPTLIAQAVRVYLVNQRQGTASTKTRGEVSYSTRKIYRQKGTGRARHGGRGAPIFVKGGVAHGPKPKKYALSLPKKMKRAALFAALSGKVKEGDIKVVSGLEKMKVKTKLFAQAFHTWAINEKNRNTLLVLPEQMETVLKGARNLEGVTITTAQNINTYEVLKHKTIIFMKEAIAIVEKTFGGRK